MRRGFITFVAVGSLAGCSAQAGAPLPSGSTSIASTHPAGKTIAYFTGTGSPSQHIMSLAFRAAPTAGMKPQSLPQSGSGGDPNPSATLDYGTGPGQSFLHTVGKASFGPNPSCPDQGLQGIVDPDDNTGSTIGGFTVVIDTITATGGTFAAQTNDGFIPATAPPANFFWEVNHGPDTVQPGGDNPSMGATWTFCVGSTADFTFTGHTEGLVGGS